MEISESNKSSIQDVAKLAGVSIATVSRTFQYPGRVADNTREHILKIARDLNYMPNAQARSLRTAKTKLVVALVPDIANPFFSEVILGVEDVAKSQGYSVLLGDTQYKVENEQRYGDMVSSRLVDGMLALVHRIPKIRIGGRLPVVNACEPTSDAEISSVTIDNAAAFQEGVGYLIALGHRHIAFIGGPSETSNARRTGYLRAMEAAGLPVVPKLTQGASYSIEAGVRAARAILAHGLPVTAFACVSDQIAIGAMHALRDFGHSVPNDVSVLGFDDIAFSRYTLPPLTTIAQPREELGREAMHMLLRLIDDRAVPVQKLTLPTQLIVRGTTAPPPAA